MCQSVSLMNTALTLPVRLTTHTHTPV